MSFQTVYTSATGMMGMEKKLNTVANNLANMETTGFKKQRCNFEDLFYDHLKYPGTEIDGNFAATGIAIGVGTRVTSTQTVFSPSTYNSTDRDLDVAITGQGFFQVNDPFTNLTLYTRAGNFSVNPAGQLVMGSSHQGRLVTPGIDIPQDATKIQINEDGRVFVAQAGNTSLQEVGQIELATFVNPEGLLRLGENLFQETDASGGPITGTPGTNGVGALKQGFLEMSNVQPVVELIDMITSQRAYELNSKVTQTGDQILQTAINIKR